VNTGIPLSLVISKRDAKVLKGGAGVSARGTVEVRRLEGQRWTELDGGPVEADQGVNVVRPAIASNGTRTCVAYGKQIGSKSPVPAVSCESNVGWQPLSSPPASQDAVMSDIDGFALGKSGAYLGLDEFRNDGVSWTIRRFEHGQWRQLGLSRHRSGWNAQGDLFRVGEEVWSAQFNQRRSGQNILADVVVRQERSDGTIDQVGDPLLRDTPLYGPLTFEIIKHQGLVYALHSLPEQRRQRNSLMLSVYRLSE
jgi:hypothetical protein